MSRDVDDYDRQRELDLIEESNPKGVSDDESDHECPHCERVVSDLDVESSDDSVVFKCPWCSRTIDEID